MAAVPLCLVFQILEPHLKVIQINISQTCDLTLEPCELRRDSSRHRRPALALLGRLMSQESEVTNGAQLDDASLGLDRRSGQIDHPPPRLPIRIYDDQQPQFCAAQ
jgi:hypothetical protein